MNHHKQSPGSGDAGKPDDITLALQCFDRLSAARADDREPWLKVGMAVHAVSTTLFSAWEEWSRKSAKFNERECARQWKSFKHDKARSLGLGSLIRWAREDSGDPNFGKAPPPSRTPRSFASLENAIVAVAESTGTKHVATWTYEYADGRPALWIARFDERGVDALGKRKKSFRPFHRAANGRYVVEDPPGPLPLYHLRQLPEQGFVYLVEGEKPADAGAALGLATTTTAHGSGSLKKSDVTPLAGREVVILQDNDKSGGKYAGDAELVLTRLQAPAVVRRVLLPGLPPGGDIVEYIAAQRTEGKSDEQIRAQIEALAQAAAPSEGNAGGLDGRFQDCPEPVELPDTRPPVPAFDYACVPSRLRGWMRDIAERMQCAPDFVFATAIVALSAVLGRKVGIRPKRFDIWTVIANLWGAVVGRPGILKSPAVNEALKPLRALDAEAKKRFRDDEKAARAAQILAEARRKAWEKDLREAVRAGGGEDLAARMAEDELQLPVRRRYVVNDSTVEKLGEILNQNPNGVFTYRDELISLLRSLDKEGQESARGFYLQSWNGDSGYIYDRIGRGTLDIPAAIVSAFGSIQPGPLEQYLRSAWLGGKGDDGLLQRFQILVFPEPSKVWKNHDRPPDPIAREQAHQVFREIDALDPDAIGAERDEFDPDAVPFLHFDDAAQELFDRWRERLEMHLRSGDEEEAFESHLAKYRSLVPSLALIYHLAERGKGSVGLEPLQQAIATSEYLEAHARRVYASAIAPELSAARALAIKLRAREVKDLFTARDVYQKGWSWLSDKASAERAISVLVDLDWILPERNEETGGAPKTQYRINPRIWNASAQATPTTATRWTEGVVQVTPVAGEGPCRNRESEPRTESDPEIAQAPTQATDTTGTRPPPDSDWPGQSEARGNGSTASDDEWVDL